MTSPLLTNEQFESVARVLEEGRWSLNVETFVADARWHRAECAKARAEIKRLREAASALLDDVHRRYPGEELRCPFMRGLDAALAPEGKEGGGGGGV